MPMTEENRVKTTLRLEKDFHKKLQKFCIDNDLTIQDFLAHAAESCMNRKDLPKTKKK